MRKFIWLLLVLTFPLSAHARSETGFLNRAIRLSGETYKYQVYLPREWSGRRTWPVILFLHGAGERGRDGLFSTEVGLGPAIRRNAAQFPFVAVFPQVPDGGEWTENNWLLPKMQRLAMATLEGAIKEFKGDRGRLYLTGLSMGGYGTLALAAKNPETFAAIAVVCGGVLFPHEPARGQSRALYAAVATAIKEIPIWMFHGDADPAVPVDESRTMYDELKAAGAAVRYYEFAGVGHNSWDAAYRDREFPQWLLSHTLASRKTLQRTAERKVIPEEP